VSSQAIKNQCTDEQAKDGFKVLTRISKTSSEDEHINLLGVQMISNSLSFYLIFVSFDEWFS